MDEWFKSLSDTDRKRLVHMLYEVRRSLTQSEHYHLNEKFLRKTDNEYHALKEYKCTN